MGVTGAGVRLRVRVQPRASRSAVVGLVGDALKVRIAAAPVEGAANAELVGLIATWLGVRKSDVRLISGQQGRSKVVEIAAADPEATAASIASAVGELSRQS